VISWIKSNTSKGSAGGAADPAAADGTGTRVDGTQIAFTEARLKSVLNAIWTNGQTHGIDWKDMQTTPGFAFGTQVNSQTYDDSTAVLTGAWGPNQFVQATVKIVKPCNAIDYEEVELRTNSAISAHSITGWRTNAPTQFSS